jgi:hypothetical protein
MGVWPDSTIYVSGHGGVPVPVGSAIVFSGSKEIYRLLPEVRVVIFETPMRQQDPKVHALSHALMESFLKNCFCSRWAGT